MSVDYTRINFADYPSTTTPLNAENLNKMDKGIADLVEQSNGQEEDIAEIKGSLSELFKFRTETLLFDSNGVSAVKFDNVTQQLTDVIILSAIRADASGIIVLPYAKKDSQNNYYWYVKAIYNDMSTFTGGNLGITFFYVDE